MNLIEYVQTEMENETTRHAVRVAVSREQYTKMFVENMAALAGRLKDTVHRAMIDEMALALAGGLCLHETAAALELMALTLELEARAVAALAMSVPGRVDESGS